MNIETIKRIEKDIKNYKTDAYIVYNTQNKSMFVVWHNKTTKNEHIICSFAKDDKENIKEKIILSLLCFVNRKLNL